MGSQEQHQTKSERCGAFVDTIRNGEYQEWVVVALFYQALHGIEMMLASKSEHTTSHEQRRRRLKEKFPEMLRFYKPLYNYSLLCRYRFQIAEPSDVAAFESNLIELKKLIELEVTEGSSENESS